MTKEKEKAIDLIAKVEIELGSTPLPKETVKKLALIAVDELIEQQKNMADFLWSEIGYLIAPPVFWEEVKDEINNL
jgi:hypothetical protein